MTAKTRPQTTARPGRPTGADDVLAHAQANRAVVQDFVPLADSLEWTLGQDYFRTRGSGAFLADARPVPFVINNDGTLSASAAEVLFAALAEAEQAAPLPPELFVLELGIGVGLFARFFLDHFRDLCAARRKNYYDRLTYVLADRSERMLRDACRHGVLAAHPGRYRLRPADALRPDDLARDLMFRGAGLAPFRAVFLNYLLDCLPVAVLEFDGDAVRQLCVRTCLARGVRLQDHTELTLPQLAARAASADARQRDDLLEVYGLFASEYAYLPVAAAAVPFADFAVEHGRRRGNRLLHSWGAVQCLERLLALTADGGFVLVNDYGQTQGGGDDFEHQRFSQATAVGVNFPLLRAYFADGGRCEEVKPSGDDERGIHTRLLGRRLGTETRLRLEQCFGKEAADRAAEPLEQARQCAKVGRFELAATFYQEAVKRQPRNWVLLNEVSMFLTYSLRDPKAGVDVAKLALALNPTCSAELWNTLGDGLYEWGRFAEARSAFERAVRVSDSDVRARDNLARVHQALGDHERALAALAEGLALDRTGEYRERLLQKQAEVLGQLGRRQQQEYLRLVNLVSRAAKPEQDKDAPEHAVPRDR